VERERDVAVRAAARDAARAAVERGRDPAAVEQEDRLAAAFREPAELGEQRRGQRVAGLEPEVDDLHPGKRRSDTAAELEPLERLPRLGPWRRRAEDRNRAFEGRALGGNRTGVVARIRLLLVRGVVLLVHADDPERGKRREHGGASPDHDRRLAGHDPLALVTPLGLRKTRVDDRDTIAEARPEATERLRRERDLRHEHDRSTAGCDRSLAGTDVDLGLAAACGTGEEDVAAPAPKKPFDPRERVLLGIRKTCRCRLRGHPGRCGHRSPLAAPLWLLRRDQRERAGGSRAVVVGEPEGEVDERRRQRLEHPLGKNGRDVRRSLGIGVHDDPAPPRVSERDREDCPLPHLVADLVGEQPRERAGADDRIDGGEAGHGQRA
jgi:hypothetical protein